MSRLQPKEILRVSKMLFAAFPTFEALDELAMSANREPALFRIMNGTAWDMALTMVREASTEMWLFDLATEALAAVPADQAILAWHTSLLSDADRIGGGGGLDHFGATCLAGQHVMVNRSSLRAALRDLRKPDGNRILLVNDAEPPAGGRIYSSKTGKSHTIQLITYLQRGLQNFELVWLDLGQIARGLKPDELIEPTELARRLVKRLGGMADQVVPAAPSDGQWSRWSLDCCDEFETLLKNRPLPVWLVIDSFNAAPLPLQTIDLLKELAARINISLPDVRLILLGYADSFPSPVLGTVLQEKLKRSVSVEEVCEFYLRASNERGLSFDEDKVVALAVEALQGLDPAAPDFLEKLAPRLHARVSVD